MSTTTDAGTATAAVDGPSPGTSPAGGRVARAARAALELAGTTPARAALELAGTTLAWALVFAGFAGLFVMTRPDLPVEQLRPGVAGFLLFGLFGALLEWAGWLPATRGAR